MLASPHGFRFRWSLPLSRAASLDRHRYMWSPSWWRSTVGSEDVRAWSSGHCHGRSWLPLHPTFNQCHLQRAALWSFRPPDVATNLMYSQKGLFGCISDELSGRNRLVQAEDGRKFWQKRRSLAVRQKAFLTQKSKCMQFECYGMDRFGRHVLRWPNPVSFLEEWNLEIPSLTWIGPK